MGEVLEPLGGEPAFLRPCQPLGFGRLLNALGRQT
jgi:hypothetical protein